MSHTCCITLERTPLDHAWQNIAYYSYNKLFARCQHCGASQNQEEMETELLPWGFCSLNMQIRQIQNAKHVAVFSFEQATMSLLKLISFSAQKTLILKSYFS